MSRNLIGDLWVGVDQIYEQIVELRSKVYSASYGAENSEMPARGDWLLTLEEELFSMENAGERLVVEAKIAMRQAERELSRLEKEFNV